MNNPELCITDLPEEDLYGKKIYLVCPVRQITEEIKHQLDELVSEIESRGAIVHYPPRDVDQNDPTGYTITFSHLQAMQKADEVWLVWNRESSGSHFDLGMAVALGKKLHLAGTIGEDSLGKSYLKVIKKIIESQKSL